MQSLKSKILLSFSLLLFGFWPLRSLALEISPLKYDLTVDPGGAQTVVVKIKNNEPAKLILQPIVLSARQDEFGRTLLGDGWGEAQAWATTDQVEFSLDSGREKAVNFAVQVPMSAGPGAHYLAVGVQEKNNSNVDSGVGLGRQLFTLVSLQVAGTAREEVVIERWESRGHFTIPVWNFDLKIRNNGNISVPLSGRVELFDWRGRETWSGEVSLGNNLLAQTSRMTQVAVSARSSGFSWPGLYGAAIHIQYGATKQTVSAFSRFWYWPSWVSWALGSLIIIIVVWLVARKLRKATT